MSYQRFRCPRGHAFRANVLSAHSQVVCEQCRQDGLRKQETTPMVAAANTPSFIFTQEDVRASAPVEPDVFVSGGGGDYGGGGASGSYDSGSSE